MLEKKPSPPAYTSSQPVKSTSSTVVTTQHAFGIFSRLTNLISQTKQDPFVLARRLLSNAWVQGSKRLGGMGWWLLGLVYGTRWRKRKRTADSETVEPTTPQDFDWHHFTAEASRRRTAEHYFRDYGACHQRTDMWLSPPPASAQQQMSPSNTTPPPPIPSPEPSPEPHLFPCPDCVEPSSRRTLRLWFQFSLAIVLAVGMAIKHGPASLLLLQDPEQPCLPTHAHRSQSPSHHPHEREPLLQPHRSRSRSRSRHQYSTRHKNKNSEDEPLVNDDDDGTSRNNISVGSNGLDSGYGSIVFAETLGPADFEANIC